MSGRTKKRTPPNERNLRRTWFDIMNEVRVPRKNPYVIPNRGGNLDDDRMDDALETCELNTTYQGSDETDQTCVA